MGSALPLLGLPSKADIYAAALEGLVRVNGLVLDKDPTIPPLYASGARWRGIRHDTWRRADQIAGEGWGDCEGLSAWRAAELRRTGEDPCSRVGVYHTGPSAYHAVVVRGDDTIEDPSIHMGMRVRPFMPRTRAEMNAVNVAWPVRVGVGPKGAIIVGDVWTDQPGGSVVDLPDGTASGQLVLPIQDGKGIIATTTPAVDRARAAAAAVSMLADISKSFAKDPAALKQIAMLNPYTAAALTLYQEPHINNALRGLSGKGLDLLRRIF